jgi:phosphate transport system substrate-binding protein
VAADVRAGFAFGRRPLRPIRTLTLLAAALCAAGSAAAARDALLVVGPEAVVALVGSVAARVSGETGKPPPTIQITGTAEGFKAFCGGVGEGFPDAAVAARPIRETEMKACVGAGVTSVTEIPIGLEGLVIVRGAKAPEMALDKAQLFQALAAKVVIDGQLIENPFERWAEVDPALPDLPITVLGPAAGSDARAVFVDRVLKPGCDRFEALKSLEGAVRDEVCGALRGDGRYVEAPAEGSPDPGRVEAEPGTIALVDTALLYRNRDRLVGVPLDGVAPTVETIGDGRYGLAGRLYVYVKNAHRAQVPVLVDFVRVLVDETTLGASGTLAARGLIPLPAAERNAVRKTALAGTPIALD